MSRVRRRPPSFATVGVGVLVLVLLLVAGCGPFDDRVEVPTTGVKGAQRTSCEELVADLPDRVADRTRRETKGSPLGAAWGDPAIVLRCGVGRPAGQGPTDPCDVADGLGWFVPLEGKFDQSKDVVMTTVERRPRVEVLLPAGYRPPTAAMLDLTAVVKQHTRKVSSCL